ncbi:uncharacterized protein LOC143916859 [Arctopsyche grandis]|uniref:uncharacterized protein LOC143916859 n=1 Tax=Arctopsyche grandis TaxID=121162 RepID=UPI00406D71BB
MVINNIYVTNATKMSLSDRFTILQSVRPVTVPQRHHRQPHVNDSERSRRLLERLALKPIAEAATSFQMLPIKQRIGVINKMNPQRRGNLWGLNKRSQQNMRRMTLLRRTNTFTNVRKTRQIRKQKRSNFVGNMSRSQSSGNLNQEANQNRNFKRGSGTRGRGQTRQPNINTAPSPVNNPTIVTSVRGRGTRRRGVFRGQNGGQTLNESNLNNDNSAGRGRGRNQKRGINRSWFAQKAAPTKDELDKQLDLYMAGTRTHLDKELDMYMSSAMDVE